jgi:hypothetical protein
MLTAVALAGPRMVVLANYPASDPYIDTIRFVQWQLKDLDFYGAGQLRELQILTNSADKFAYKLWLQPSPAPLVFILPGLGGHFASEQPAALAETLYARGCSVALLSSAFNWEFVLSAHTKIVPGYTPADAQDVYRAIQEICRDIRTEYGAQRITACELTGYSLGGLHTLFIADLDRRERKVGFERYVAINPPVNLLYGLRELDAMYSVWTNWPDEQIEESRDKAVNIYRKYFEGEEGTVITNLQFDMTSEEARFAIGYTFRRTLQEVLMAVKSRRNFGVVEDDPGTFNRRQMYRELEQYSYYNYLRTFLQAAHPELGQTEADLRRLNADCSLFAVQPMLMDDPRIHVFHNEDDFLLTDYDREWLSGVLGERLTMFDHGGHLGNLYRDDVQAMIADALTGKPSDAPAARQTATEVPPLPQPRAETAFRPVAPKRAAQSSANIITEPDETPLDGTEIMRMERESAGRVAQAATADETVVVVKAEPIEARAETEGAEEMEQAGDARAPRVDVEEKADNDAPPPLEPPEDLGRRQDVIIEFREN